MKRFKSETRLTPRGWAVLVLVGVTLGVLAPWHMLPWAL